MAVFVAGIGGLLSGGSGEVGMLGGQGVGNAGGASMCIKREVGVLKQSGA